MCFQYLAAGITAVDLEFGPAMALNNIWIQNRIELRKIVFLVNIV